MPGLEFKGKQQVYAHHLTVAYRTLVRDWGRSVNPAEADDNLIVHGDNLDGLKALLPRYSGRVKCVYIDPPYNTGNEGWVYNDRVNSPLMREWLRQNAAVDGEDLERHDKWLCMMWPRLQLLRELLSEDGVIFVSIDDNEHHHLRLMMDEIFGPDNFMESFIWRSRLGRGATSKNTAKLHEYVIAYAKSADVSGFKSERRIRERESRERLRQWGQGDRREDRPTMYYPVNSSEYGDVYPIRPDGTDGRWRVGEVAMGELLANGEVVFEEQSDGRIEAYRVIAAGTETSIAYPSMFDPEIVKTTAHGSIEVREILGAGQFAYPKPTSLIKEIISLCTNDGDIVLDSFAGSGTTAHAVLALNKRDGGNRRFILVECEDYADGVTAERVRRVMGGVAGARDLDLRDGLGGSFTYCTLGEAIDEEGMLTGEALPEFGSLAAYLLYVAAGVSVGGGVLRRRDEYGLFYQDDRRAYYLLYEADLEFLRSNDAMLDVERARGIAEAVRAEGRRAVVFGAGKYIGQRMLTDWGITFCQIPYEMHYPLPG